MQGQYGVIMAGGSGTRLWPMSRGQKPKQLLNVIGGKSLLRLAYERLRAVLPADRIMVCTGEGHRAGVREALPELGNEQILGEPTGRDTANAIGFAATVLHQRDPAAVAAFVSADHVIEPIDSFAAAIRAGFAVVEREARSLVTFGIVPTYGHTGLGYVQRGDKLPIDTQPAAYRVIAFKEKPDKSTADRYVESGRYYWNSGMFVWRCSTILDELGALLPENAAMLRQIGADWNTPNQQSTLARLFPSLPKISIDYAVMEPASQGKSRGQVVVVEMPVQWLDVGSWPALAETLKADEHNNAVSGGRVVLVDSDDNIIITDDPDHLISVVGVSDMVIVHTRDVTMMCPRAESQRVKDLVARVNERFGALYQ